MSVIDYIFGVNLKKKQLKKQVILYHHIIPCFLEENIISDVDDHRL